MSAGGALLGVLFVGIGVTLTGVGLRSVRRGRAIGANEPTAIGEAIDATGRIEVEGTVLDRNTFDAPFSGDRVVLSTYTVEERKSNENAGTRQTDRNAWRTVARGRIGRSLVIDDGTGRLAVDPAEATIDTGSLSPTESVSEGGELSEATRLRLSALTGEIDDFETILPGSKRRRYSEGTIEPGSEIHVYGGVVDRNDPGAGIDATVTGAGDDHYRITAGDESDAVYSAFRNGFWLVVVGLFFGGFGSLAAFASIGLV